MTTPPRKLVSQTGVLHLLADEKRAKIDFAKVHGIKDKKYLEYHLAGEQDESYGWQLLEKVRWLRHLPSGVIVPIVGKPKTFFDARAAVCERAGLEIGAMPWADHGIRQFERLLDPEDENVEDMDGWVLADEPSPVQDAACEDTCTVCLCACIDLYALVNPKLPDEAAQLRQQLAVTQQQLAQVTKARDDLDKKTAELKAAKKIVAQAARRRKEKIIELKSKMMRLTGACHEKFERLMRSLPLPARHLRHLWEAQLRALQSKSLRCYWHEEILSWCAKIFRKDRGAYELIIHGKVGW